MGHYSVRFLLAVFFQIALFTSDTLFAETVATPKPPEPTIETAISAVYPALVQVYVLSIGHDGGRERKFQSSGSGTIITTDGHVVTNHHVAGKSVAIKCILSNREEIDATLVGTDPLADIAILKLDLASRPAGSAPISIAKFGTAESLKVGDTVLAMGCPLAISQSVTRGIVSNVDMMVPTRGGRFELEGEDVGSLVKWIGHDAVIFPGNSGGPLVNLKGEIVGVNEIGMGLGGAIPCDIAKHVSEELIAKGRVRRSWTGVVFQPLLKYNGNNVKSGVLISGILAGSPAERAGLKAGDVVIAIDEQAIHVQFQQELPALIKLLCAKPVDAMIQFKIVRAGEEITLAVKSELRDDAQGKDIESKEWGLTLRRLSVLESKELKRSDLNGVLVDSVRPGGPCDQAQPSIAARDVIVEVAGKPITDLESFVKITTEITEGKTAPVPTLVAYERRTERCLTLVEIGIRKPQDPPEEVKKAWLSVTTQVLSKKLATALELKGKKGVRITQVYPDTTAEKAGFKVGDILTHIDAAAIEASEPQDAQVFETMLRSYKVTDKAEFTVLRGKQTLKITSELTPTPKSERELKTYEDNALEFKARDISFMDRVKNSWKKDETGVLVTQTDAGGWAAVGGLRSDDLILSVDSKPVTEIKDLEPLLVSVREKQPRAITLFVKRGSHTLYLQLEPRWLEKK